MRQNIWIVRYGLTKFPLVEDIGPFNSPLDPMEGLVHANAIAQKLREEVAAEDVGIVHVYASPFTRTTETANIIASRLPSKNAGEEEPRVRVEEGLTEWQQKSLLVDPTLTITYPLTPEELSLKFSKIDLSYESVNPQESCRPNGQGGVLKEESEDDLFERCSTTIRGILDKRASQGESFVVVSHAPCDQSIAVCLEGSPALKDSTLSAWPLGGITKFSRHVEEDGKLGGSWKMDFYGNTDHMPGDYKGGLKAWSLPTLAKQGSSSTNPVAQQ